MSATETQPDMEWLAKIDRITELQAAYEAETIGDWSVEGSKEYLAAVDQLLIECQAPSLQAVEQKLALITQTYEASVIEKMLIDALLRDVRHLLVATVEV